MLLYYVHIRLIRYTVLYTHKPIPVSACTVQCFNYLHENKVRLRCKSKYKKLVYCWYMEDSLRLKTRTHNQVSLLHKYLLDKFYLLVHVHSINWQVFPWQKALFVCMAGQWKLVLSNKCANMVVKENLSSLHTSKSRLVKEIVAGGNLASRHEQVKLPSNLSRETGRVCGA